jgi:hypothetical protein
MERNVKSKEMMLMTRVAPWRGYLSQEEAYDPISMTTIIKNLTEKFLTKQFPGKGCTVNMLRKRH